MDHLPEIPDNRTIAPASILIPLTFSSHDTAKLQRIAELYEAVKVMILFGEEISPNNFTLPQILKELRDAFDHIMRVIAAKLGLKSGAGEDYTQINLDKVFGHVYRCAYDVMDWVSLILRARIEGELKKYSSNAITAAIPTYYSVIRPRLYSTIPQEIAKIRGNKDIGSPDPKAISEYADCVYDLKEYWDTVVRAKDGLIDYANREKGKKLIEYAVVFILGIITAAIVGVAIWYFLPIKVTL